MQVQTTGAVGGGGSTRGGVVDVVAAGVWGQGTSTPSAPTVGGEATPTDKTPTSGRPGKTGNPNQRGTRASSRGYKK